MRLSTKTTCFLCLCLFTLGTLSVFAQESTSSDPASPQKSHSYLRVRVMAVGLQTPITVSLKNSAPETPKILDNFVPSQPTTTPYESIPSKGGSLEITIGGTSANLDLDLLPEGFYTLLFFQNGSDLEQKLLRDSVPPGASGQLPLRIFNYGSNRSAQIKIADFPLINSAPGTFQEIELSASGTLPMQVVVPDPAGGYPALSIGEIFFDEGKSTSIVILPDYRGKFRPRVWQDAVLE